MDEWLEQLSSYYQHKSELQFKQGNQYWKSLAEDRISKTEILCGASYIVQSYWKLPS